MFVVYIAAKKVIFLACEVIKSRTIRTLKERHVSSILYIYARHNKKHTVQRWL